MHKTISFFAALCLFLSAVEYAFPKPLPFMRIGLANLPVLLSLPIMRRRDTLLLVAIKVLGQNLLAGTLFSYILLFSAAGSFASALVMMALYTLFFTRQQISFFGLCVGGALANNAAQLLLARFILFGESTRYIAPLLLTTGLISGSLLGLFSQRFAAKSRWYATVRKELCAL